MGGDNPIAHGFGDALEEGLMDGRLEELKASLDLKDEDLLPSREWISELFRLRDNERAVGRTVLTPDIFVHASLESSKMRGMDWLDPADIPNVSDATILELLPLAKDMYQGHSGIHSMLYRQDRLEAASAIFLRSLDVDTEANMYYRRLAANMYEELAWYDMFKGEVGSHHEIAVRLNEEVADAEDTFNTQYKIHARMSLYDLRAVEVLANHNSIPNRRLYQDLRDIHVDFNDELIEISELLKQDIKHSEELALEIENDEERAAFSRHRFGRATSAVGTLTEGIALSVLQGHILNNRLFDKYWAMQSFMRQDTMGRTRIAISPDKDDQLAALNITFDLQVFDFSQAEGQMIPIEVKKQDRARRLWLHPDIEVAKLNIPDTPIELTETIKTFATVQNAKLLRQDYEKGQGEIHTMIYNKVNPQLLLKRLS